ncbi:MAG TPA: hypothetical protein C5S50_05235, partial [Methanosarcinaceae archaeon]|nr:hypothetical protein [Methanosarcinaceae archaeon]
MHEMAEPFTRLFERFELTKFDLAGTRESITKPLKIAGNHLELSDDVITQVSHLKIKFDILRPSAFAIL